MTRFGMGEKFLLAGLDMSWSSFLKARTRCDSQRQHCSPAYDAWNLLSYLVFPGSMQC